MGPFSCHLGSAFITEGFSDLMFVFQSGGRFSMNDYISHKWKSMLMTVVFVGVGAWLTKGASLSLVTQTASEVGLQVTSKLSTKTVALGVFKKMLHDVIKTAFNHGKSKMVQKLSSVFMKLVFNQLRDNIVSMIQVSDSYLAGINELRQLLFKLHSHKTHSEASTILEEQMLNAELEMSENINNKIVSLAGSVAGPLASQVSEASQIVQYSGLTANSNNLIENKQSELFSTIAMWISKAMQMLRYVNSVYELITLVSDLVENVIKKIRMAVAQMSETTETLINRSATEEQDQRTNLGSEYIFLVISFYLFVEGKIQYSEIGLRRYSSIVFINKRRIFIYFKCLYKAKTRVPEYWTVVL
jgi:hypothetical protein